MSSPRGKYGLRLNHWRFVEEYCRCYNGTEAATKAGYTQKNAKRMAWNLLQRDDIQDAIAEEIRQAAAANDLTPDRVLNEVGSIAFFDPRRLFDREGALKRIIDMDADVAAAIASVEVVTKGNADIGFGEITKIKFWDKTRNLDLLGKYLKLWTDRDLTVNVGGNLADRLKAARERATREA